MLTFPFTALVGLDELKLALVLNAVAPEIGGVLICGEKGTAKSTAARALAQLLPPIAVRPDCPCNTAPEDPVPSWLEPVDGNPSEVGNVPATSSITTPFVELPLGATEDRVAGTLNFERALREGKRVFQPGLLAAANRGILYVDEVNLLPDHLVDLLLDSAASGRNVVQREGIEVAHDARFFLVGTMNPEEGNLRPQLLDRFGLMVEVRGTSVPAVRSEVVRRRMAFECDPAAFVAHWQHEQEALRSRVVAARALLPDVSVTNDVLLQIAELCCEAGVDGMRADLALYKTSRAHAALQSRTRVTRDDVLLVAKLVLPHRRKRRPLDNKQADRSPRSAPSAQQPEPRHENSTQPPQSEESSDRGDDAANSSPDDDPGSSASLQIFAADRSESIRPIALAAPKAVLRPQPGRRNRSEGTHAGRYVRAVADTEAKDIAMAATLRSAAVQGGWTESATGGRLSVQRSDLHRKERAGKVGTLILLVVDASGSMAARRRMEAVKGAVLSLLTDAYQQRDRVAVIAFRGVQAETLLAPSLSVDLAQQALGSLPTGGRTPLAHALHIASETIGRERQTTPDLPLLLVLLTDGKANVPLPDSDGDAWKQALTEAARLADAGVPALVVDTETDYIRHGRSRLIADAASAEYLSLENLTAETLALEIRQRS